MKHILTLLLLLIAFTAKGQNPTDSIGLWAVHDGNMKRMEKITFQKVKGSGGLGSAFSFGLAKIKAKMEFKGATSEHIFEGTAKFRMIFGNPPIQQMQSLYMFANKSNMRNFEVAKFQVKKNTRLLTGVSASILGSQVGVSSADDVEIVTKELGDGIYDISVKAAPGEYCFMCTTNAMGALGGVFDFTIK